MAKDTSDSLKAKISKTQKEIKKMKEQLVKDSEKLFKISCQEIFENNPDFNSFSWCQYTPHWNDGDTCEFSAHIEYIYIDNEEESSDVYSTELDYKELKQKEKTIKRLTSDIEKLKAQGRKDDDLEIENNKERIKKLNNINLEQIQKRLKFLEDISSLLDNIDEDTLERMFGDHAKVVVTKDGIEVEHYDHD